MGMWDLTTAQMVAASTVGSEGDIPAMQWWIALVLGLLFVLGLFIHSYKTRSGIIARATTKEAIRQPVFLFVLVISLLFLVVNTFLPFFSMGEDIKMLKDCGLATLLIAGLLLAVWTSSTSIADEIEGKTAMTVLSKPINRRQFIVGKYIGIVQAVLLLLVPLVIVFCLLLFYKVGYDAREASKEIPGLWDAETGWFNAERLAAVVQTLPGIVLIFLETAVLAAVSVAISTRAPMVVNVVACLAIFVVGHLTPVLVQTGVLRLEFVSFMARLIATLLPSLEVFNTQAAVATGILVPPVYLAYSTLYCAAYCTAAILLAFILFEDRDLA